MSTLCQQLHDLCATLEVYRFPFDARSLPHNGLYLLFEEGEPGHGAQRIVRIGTHTGANQLPSRLTQHFLLENKDRSIFRKNIGRALLARDGDPFLAQWEIDLTSSTAKARYGALIDRDKLRETEQRVSEHMRRALRFVVVPVERKEDRLRLESRLISTVSLCHDCGPSPAWLGQWSPKREIRESGLWLVQHLYEEPASERDLAVLEEAARRT